MIDANETGTLGVIYLRRYWSRITGARLGVRDGKRGEKGSEQKDGSGKCRDRIHGGLLKLN